MFPHTKNQKSTLNEEFRQAQRKAEKNRQQNGGSSSSPPPLPASSALAFLDMYGGENKSHLNVMAIRNQTRKNYRGGYRYSELGMKGLTIALTDGARVFAPKKPKKSRKGKMVKKGKNMGKIGKFSVRRSKGSPKKRNAKK